MRCFYSTCPSGSCESGIHQEHRDSPSPPAAHLGAHSGLIGGGAQARLADAGARNGSRSLTAVPASASSAGGGFRTVKARKRPSWVRFNPSVGTGLRCLHRVSNASCSPVRALAVGQAERWFYCGMEPVLVRCCRDLGDRQRQMGKLTGARRLCRSRYPTPATRRQIRPGRRGCGV